jgi:phage terminase small subunit
MTERQRRFCLEYVACGNASEAARKAGYTKLHAKEAGAECLTKPNVQAEIARLVKERDAKAVAQADELLARLTAIARGESREDSLLVVDKQLVHEPVPANHKDQLKAIELLGKFHGMFEDRLKLSGAVGVNPFSDLTADELRQLIKK